MTITVNGEPARPSPTIAALLQERFDHPAPLGVAVAVNGEVAPRSTWPGRLLQQGDAVEIVTAKAGG